VWARAPDDVGQRTRRKQRPSSQKEGQTWLTSLEAVGRAHEGCPQPRLVSGGDRDAAVYDLRAAVRPAGVELVMRAAWDRAVSAPERYVWATVEAQPLGEHLRVQVSRRGPHPGRDAPLALRLCPVTLRPPRHARWVAVYEAVRTLQAQGTPIATVARQLGISRPTVYAYLRRDTPPGPRRLQRPPSARVLTPYVPHLIRRWRESGADSRQLWRELQTLGYTHSARTVGRFITRLRRAADAGHPPESQRSPYTCPQGPSARAVSFVVVGSAAKRSAEAQTYLDQLGQMDARIAQAQALTQGFLTLVRERRGHDLEAWITAATASGIDGLARCAHGLREDLAAGTAGLTLEWSNGPVEGQITRLKLHKRQGYGRAGFALLRQRVLQAA
jgi:hypothetical protein